MTWNLWVALVLIVSWVAVHRITRDTPREKRALLQVEHDLEREEAQRLDARPAVAPLRRAEQRTEVMTDEAWNAGGGRSTPWRATDVDDETDQC